MLPPRNGDRNRTAHHAVDDVLELYQIRRGDGYDDSLTEVTEGDGFTTEGTPQGVNQIERVSVGGGKRREPEIRLTLWRNLSLGL